MIFGMARIMLFAMIAMAILYVILWLYSRSVRIEKLENQASEKVAAGELTKEEVDAFVQTGLEAYQNSLRPKLILGVFAIPWIIIGVMIYVTNFM